MTNGQAVTHLLRRAVAECEGALEEIDHAHVWPALTHISNAVAELLQAREQLESISREALIRVLNERYAKEDER